MRNLGSFSSSDYCAPPQNSSPERRVCVELHTVDACPTPALAGVSQLPCRRPARSSSAWWLSPRPPWRTAASCARKMTPLSWEFTRKPGLAPHALRSYMRATYTRRAGRIRTHATVADSWPWLCSACCASAPGLGTMQSCVQRTRKLTCLPTSMAPCCCRYALENALTYWAPNGNWTGFETALVAALAEVADIDFEVGWQGGLPTPRLHIPHTIHHRHHRPPQSCPGQQASWICSGSCARSKQPLPACLHIHSPMPFPAPVHPPTVGWGWGWG